MLNSPKSLGFAGLTALFVTTSGLAITPQNTLPVIAQVSPAAPLKQEGDRLFEQADQLYDAGQYELAFETWTQALEHYRDPAVRAAFPEESRLGEAETLDYLGIIYADWGQYDQAIRHYEQSLAIDRELDHAIGEADSLGSLALSYFYLSDFEQSLTFLEEVLAIIRDSEVRRAFPQDSLRIEATALGARGNVFVSSGDYDNAIHNYQQYLELAQEYGDRQSESNALVGLGNAHYSLQDYDRATDYYERSLAITEELDLPSQLRTTLDNIGSIYRALGQHRQALEYHQRSFDIDQQANNRFGMAISLDNIGSAYRDLGNNRRAIQFHRRSLAINQEIGNREGEGIALNNIGVAQINMRQGSEAEDTLYQAVGVFESIRTNLPEGQKITLLDAQANAYDNLERALIGQNKIEEALVVTERSRAQAFAVRLTNNLNSRLPQNSATIAESVAVPSVEDIKRIGPSLATEKFWSLRATVPLLMVEGRIVSRLEQRKIIVSRA